MRWRQSFLSAALSTIHNAAIAESAKPLILACSIEQGSEELLQPSKTAENQKRFV